MCETFLRNDLLVACCLYVALGGEIEIFPAGLSSVQLRAEMLRYGARRKSIAGWMARFGVRRIPEEALPYVLRLELSVPVARVGLIWTAAHDREPVRLGTIAARAELDRKCCARTAAVLVDAGRMRIFDRGRSTARYLALGDTAPHWREFLKGAAHARAA